jgi:hypothetical protein
LFITPLPFEGAGKMVWQRRFVAIRGSRLYYYKDKTRAEVLGTIWLIGGNIRENKEDSAVTMSEYKRIMASST